MNAEFNPGSTYDPLGAHQQLWVDIWPLWWSMSSLVQLGVSCCPLFLPWSQRSMPRAQHPVFYACKDTTWTRCLFYKVLGAFSKTYGGGIQLINGRTVHVLKVFGFLPQKLSHMVKVIGSHTCLWVYVKKESGQVFGPFFANGTLGIKLISGALFHFEAQVSAISTA